MKNSKILILGSQGMLGQEFLRQLKMGTRKQGNKETVEVIGWDRPQLDITDQQSVEQKIRELNPDFVINCAAYNAVDKAEDDPEVANLINGTAVGYLAQATANCGAVFVHFSTDYVFDGEKTNGYQEDDAPCPISKYGQSKLLGEQQLINLSAYKLTNWYLVRTSKLFGPPGPSEMSKPSFPQMMLDLARKNGKVLAINSEVGSPTYVKDLVQATLVLIGFPPLKVRGGAGGVMNEEGLRQGGLRQSYPSGVYHLTNSGSCTWYEYAQAVVEYAGINAEVVPVGADHFPRKAKRPQRVILLNTKFLPLRSWQEALKEFLQTTE